MVIVVKNRITPYVQLQITPAKFSITDLTAVIGGNVSAAPYLNALMMETAVGAGMDYPFSTDLIVFLGGSYRFSAFTSLETTSGIISYHGLEILTGVMTNFY